MRQHRMEGSTHNYFTSWRIGGELVQIHSKSLTCKTVFHEIGFLKFMLAFWVSKPK